MLAYIWAPISPYACLTGFVAFSARNSRLAWVYCLLVAFFLSCTPVYQKLSLQQWFISLVTRLVPRVRNLLFRYGLVMQVPSRVSLNPYKHLPGVSLKTSERSHPTLSPSYIVRAFSCSVALRLPRLKLNRRRGLDTSARPRLLTWLCHCTALLLWSIHHQLQGLT